MKNNKFFTDKKKKKSPSNTDSFDGLDARVKRSRLLKPDKRTEKYVKSNNRPERFLDEDDLEEDEFDDEAQSE